MPPEKDLNSVERLISIYDRLRKGEILTAANLADIYDVCIRTIQRDIKKMRKAGVDIYGYHEGYKIIN